MCKSLHLKPPLLSTWMHVRSVDEMSSSSDCTVHANSVTVLGSIPTSTLQHTRIQGAADDAVLNNVQKIVGLFYCNILSGSIL